MSCFDLAQQLVSVGGGGQHIFFLSFVVVDGVCVCFFCFSCGINGYRDFEGDPPQYFGRAKIRKLAFARSNIVTAQVGFQR